MTTKELFKQKMTLNKKSTESSQALADYCQQYRGAMGLISNECRDSEEYKKLKLEFDTNWHKLRVFNGLHNKNKDLQKLIKEDIMERRMAGVKNNV